MSSCGAVAVAFASVTMLELLLMPLGGDDAIAVILPHPFIIVLLSILIRILTLDAI